MKHDGKDHLNDEPAPESEEQSIVIFRCGSCGWPCDDGGKCLKLGYDEACAYLGDHHGSEEKLVNGDCCPNGPDH